MKTEIASTNEQLYDVDSAFLFDKTIERPEDEADFILNMNDFRLNEAALFAVSSIRGIVFNQYVDEITKPSPDHAKIREMKEQLEHIAKERNLVYSGDQAIKRLVISKYAPKIRAALEAQKDLLSHGR